MLLGYVVAALLAVISLGGLRTTAYANETSALAAQAIAQDWFDLWILAPVIAISAATSVLGSARARYVLMGGLLFAAYTAAIYCFSVHFNALFLVYCATLGASIYGLAIIAAEIHHEPSYFVASPRARRLAAGCLIAIGGGFALLWLAQILPALAAGEPPRQLTELGIPTNPVHVLDLAIVLPLHVIAGVGLWRGTRLGLLLAPMMLAFGALMAGSIAVLVVLGPPSNFPLAAVFAAIALLEGGLLVRFLRAHTMQHQFV